MGAVLGIFFLFLIFIGVMVYLALPSAPSVSIGQFELIVGNGTDPAFLALMFPWPYTRRGNQITVTYVFQLPALTTLAHPALPVLVSLPTPTRGDLKGFISSTSIPLSGSDEDLTVVQLGQAVAFRFKPSGHYLVGGNLTSSYGIVFTVTYTAA